MPVEGGIGFGPGTIYKQFTLDKAAGAILGKATEVAKRYVSPCIVLDMTCGPGIDPKGQDGSPLVLAKHVQFFQDRGCNIRLVCVDRIDSHLDKLEPLLRSRFPKLNFTCMNSQAHALATTRKDALGLSYWDTTRYKDLDAALLTQHGNHHRWLDILFSRECLAGFRVAKAGLDVNLIDEYLKLTGKDYGYIIKFANWGWWSMGFASNLGSWPKLNRGWERIDTERGQQLLRDITGGLSPNGSEP